MTARRRGRLLLRWLRNLLFAAGILSLWLGVTTAIDLRLQEEQVLPTPPAFGDLPVQPAFNEEAASAMPYTNCVACHWDKLGKGGVAAAADPDESSLPAQVARIMAAKQQEADQPQAGGEVAPSPTPTRPPLPVIREGRRVVATSVPQLGPSPIPSPTRLSGIPVRLAIPSLTIDSSVVAVGATIQNGQAVWAVPRDVVGWFEATTPAGAEGNTVMSGHVTQREGLGVFRDLYQIRLGAPIYVDTTAGQVSYMVREIRIVLPSETQYLQPTESARLTLITCTGRYDAATRTFSHRLIVIAQPQ